jgi:heterodisulfide reductase subunit A-like polyferredoxin
MTIKRRDLLAGGAGVVASVAAVGLAAQAEAPTKQSDIDWHREADVVVIGSGATGLPAAIVAREGGSSVIVVETESHTGGHAICSGGNVP